MKLRTLATLFAALTLSMSVHHGRLRIATPSAFADDGDGGGGGDDGAGNDNGDDNGNDNGNDDTSEEDVAMSIDVGYSGFASLDPGLLDALMDQSAAEGYGNIGQQAGAIGAATTAAAMSAGVDPLGAANLGMAAAVAAQSAIDANQSNHGIATNAAQAVGITAAQEALGLDPDQTNAIAIGISNEVDNWGGA